MLDRSAAALDGKVAIVTGGGGGIGRAISETFAAFGARVVIAEIDEGRAKETEAAIRERGHEGRACVVDVREPDDVSRLRDATLEAHGRVDVLVNNVGDFLHSAKFLRSGPADWDALHRILFTHVMHCTHALAPQMVEQGDGGSIINVSTIEAFRGIPGAAVYSAYNCAITGFTRSLALELGPERIRVNAIAPETTDTLQVPVGKWLPEEHRDRIPYWIPIGRFGKPDDMAGCAVFLASDLSAWVTGTTLHCDGGALAAGGFYRIPSGGWTNTPIVTGSGMGVGSAEV